MSEVSTMATIQMQLDSWRGYSAYEIAVKNGFEGTEEEWLESLKGAPGADVSVVTVNNKEAVDGNITIRATDIYVEAGLPKTVAQALQECMSTDIIVDSLESDEKDKVLWKYEQLQILLERYLTIATKMKNTYIFQIRNPSLSNLL